MEEMCNQIIEHITTLNQAKETKHSYSAQGTNTRGGLLEWASLDCEAKTFLLQQLEWYLHSRGFEVLCLI